MPASSWLNFKRDQFLDSTTFVTQTKYPKAFTFFLYSCFLFYYNISVKKHPKISLSCAGVFFFSLYGTALWLCKLKKSLNSDIETNLGPAKKYKNKSFSICHWNLNGITVHGYAKVSLLNAYITAHKMDKIVYWKPTLTLVHNYTMIIYKFQDIIWFVLIIHRITDVVVFAYNTKHRCLLESSISVLCRNGQVLKWY